MNSSNGNKVPKKPDDWDGIKSVEIKPNTFINSLISRMENAPAKLWVGELTIGGLAWVAGLKTSDEPALYIFTIIIALFWAFFSTKE